MPLYRNNFQIWYLPFLAFFTLSIFYWLNFFLQGGILPPVWPDEVLFFSPAFQLAHNQKLTTEVLIGLIPGMESKTLWMPPVYMILSAFFQSIFVSDLMTVRLLSACSIYLAAVSFALLLFRLEFSKLSVLLAFATIITEPLLFRFGIPARMEGVTILMFMISLLFASSKFPTNNKLFLAGLFLSLSILSHPFATSLGLIVLYLLIKDKEEWQKKIFFFVLGGFIPLLGWLYYISPDWNLFALQFGAQIIRKKALFASFSLITKLKIFLFGFAFFKARFLLILLQVGIFLFLTIELLRTKHRISQRLILYWIWMISVLLAIYSSSEGWYVIHFLFPFALGMAILSEQKYLGLSLVLVGISLSLLGWIQIINTHWIMTNSDLILREQFEHINISLIGSKKIYLQSIPDPYFYLKEKNPDMQILEFIPGELEIPSESFRKTISEQDAFVFYNDELKNQAITDFLNLNPSWLREEWKIPVTNDHWFNFKTIIYRKPLTQL